MALTAKQLLIDLLGRDYLAKKKVIGNFSFITDNEEI